MSKAPIKKTDLKTKWAQRSLKGSPAQVLEERKKLLVVTQDKKSSRYYFEAWRSRFAKGAVYLSVSTANLTPLQLVQYLPTLRHQKESEIAKAKSLQTFAFDEVWVVFDRDSFPDFDQAVYALRKMRKDGYREAWSNECFELWYLLHSMDISSEKQISRRSLFSMCAQVFDIQNVYHQADYTKLKGDAGKILHEAMANRCPDEIFQAIVRANDLVSGTVSRCGGPSAQPSLLNPLTCVHDLIDTFVMQSPEFVNASTHSGGVTP